MNEFGYLDELISHYYSKIGETYRSSLKSGQLVRTHFFYGFEDLDAWRPKSLDDSKTIATSFEICPSPPDKFKKRTPLSAPPLATNEKFIVVKAKPRPAIIITLPTSEISIKDIRGGGKINLDLILIAPLFSLEGENDKAKYPEEFVNRVRRIKYPHLFFLPKYEQLDIKNSLCRFDRISPAYLTHLEPEDLCLNKEVFDIFFSQLQCYLTDTIEGDYKTAYELLNE